MKRATAPDPTPVAPKELDTLLAAIEPTRIQILFLIGKRGRMCVGDIAGYFRVTRPAISHHLKVLKVCGLLETRREGQQIFYALSKSHLIATLRGLADAFDRCC
jgi:DNA-binding transcriptional ArsR family regulator